MVEAPDYSRIFRSLRKISGTFRGLIKARRVHVIGIWYDWDEETCLQYLKYRVKLLEYNY